MSTVGTTEYHVTCPQHGKLGTVASDDAADTLAKTHITGRHTGANKQTAPKAFVEVTTARRISTPDLANIKPPVKD
jgi:hypothetical protein